MAIDNSTFVFNAYLEICHKEPTFPLKLHKLYRYHTGIFHVVSSTRITVDSCLYLS